MHTGSWQFRIKGGTFLVVTLLFLSLYLGGSWFIGTSLVLLSGAITYDAQRRAVPEYLNPWLFYLAAFCGLVALARGTNPVSVSLGMIAASLAVLLVVPYRLDSQVSRRTFIVAIINALSLLVVSLIPLSLVLQAAVAVTPGVVSEELWQRPVPEWWRKAMPFAILTLLALISLIVSALLHLS